MQAGGAMGIAPVAPDVDFAAAKDHVTRVIDTIKPVDSVERFEGLGVRVITEYGHFTGPRTVQAGAHGYAFARVRPIPNWKDAPLGAISISPSGLGLIRSIPEKLIQINTSMVTRIDTKTVRNRPIIPHPPL